MRTVALRDVALIERNGVDPRDLSPGTPYLGLEHIERGGRIVGRDTVGDAKITSTKFAFTPEHVLYGKLRPYLGKVSRPDFEGVCSTDILPIRPSDQIDRDYLAHYLGQQGMVDFAAARATGANLPRLSPSVLATFPVPLPSIAEQRRIAAILDHADALRAKHRQALAHLDTLTQSIFHSMFGREPWQDSLGSLAEVQIGPFGSLLHVDDYVAGGVPVLNPMHIQSGKLAPERGFSVTEAKASSLSRYRLRSGDVVLGRRGEMGRAAVATADHVGMLCGTGSLILRPLNTDSTFLHAVLTSRRMKDHLERSALGSTLPNLNAGIVKASPAPRTPNRTQLKFVVRAERVNAQRAVVERALAADDELFASLQSRAFSGGL